MRKWLVVAALIVAAGVLGVYLGDAIAERSVMERRSLLRESIQKRLESEISGIARGESFPQLTVWAPDGNASRSILDLIPDGGIVVLVSSGCQDCIEDILAIRDAARSKELPPGHIIILGNSSEDTRVLAAEMELAGVELPLYCDVPQSMHREYRVLTTPCYFVIDANGIVTDFGGGRRTTGELERVVESFQQMSKQKEGQ